MEKILLLNADYTAISIISLRKAILLLVKEKAIIIEENKEKFFIYKNIKFPNIIKLIHWVKIPYRMAKINKFNLLLRDNYTCQYCGCELSKHSMTIDHIIPKSIKYSNNWKNLVSSCKRCNLIKNNRTPDQAGMKLINIPYEPRWTEIIKRQIIYENWKQYFI